MIKVSELVQQKLAQLLLLPWCMLAKSIFYARQTKRSEKQCKIFKLRWNDTRKWIDHCRCFNIKGCRKMKNNNFFFKMRKFFCLLKMLPTQTSNLAICLGILRWYLPYASVDCRFVFQASIRIIQQKQQTC